MKHIIKYIVIILLSLGILGMNFTSAGFFGDLINKSGTSNPYCNTGDCPGLSEGVQELSGIKTIVTDQTASSYIQKIVRYLLTFISIIAVIYIIYAGFNILTGAGDEEKTKKSKSIIIYVIIGLLIIYLAGPITSFILNIFKNA